MRLFTKKFWTKDIFQSHFCTKKTILIATCAIIVTFAITGILIHATANNFYNPVIEDTTIVDDILEDERLEESKDTAKEEEDTIIEYDDESEENKEELVNEETNNNTSSSLNSTTSNKNSSANTNSSTTTKPSTTTTPTVSYVNGTYTFYWPSAFEPSKPSTIEEVTYDYVQSLTLYMMVKDIYSYEITFSLPYSDFKANEANLSSIVSNASHDTFTYHHTIGSFYGRSGYSYTGNSTTTTLTISIGSSQLSNSTISSNKATFKNTITSTLNKIYNSGAIKTSDSNETKAKYYFEWCAKNIAYDYSFSPISYTGYGALINGTSVCQGYVSVFNALCNATGISSYGVHNTEKTHIYSRIYINKAWINVDPTFGDSGNSGNYSYFNCNK